MAVDFKNSHKLQVASHKLQVTSYKSQDERKKIKEKGGRCRDAAGFYKKRQETRGKRQEARDKQPLSQASMVFCRPDKDRRDAPDKAIIDRLFCDLRLATCI